mmetsp:Transcript_17484/g.36532  ORF Transcript_17484/g.36532 Transcript_17484/m.36532 type:complete len:113 (+) Transcript_17484:208-546(+)
MYPAAGKQRKATSEATSTGSPTLPNGVFSKTDLRQDKFEINFSIQVTRQNDCAHNHLRFILFVFQNLFCKRSVNVPRSYTIHTDSIWSPFASQISSQLIHSRLSLRAHHKES